MKITHRHLVVVAASALLFGTGCASRKFVRNQTRTVQEDVLAHVSAVEGQVEDAQAKIADHEDLLIRQGVEIDRASDTARDALDRALEAGKLAEGKLLYEVVLNSDRVGFGFEDATLNPEASAALDAFAEALKAENKNVYIEIQGHTDSSGPEDFNLQLGERRAESVRRYLNLQHGIPLHRMSVISYGESAPLVEENSREARAQNRRVSLVVLM